MAKLPKLSKAVLRALIEEPTVVLRHLRLPAQ